MFPRPNLTETGVKYFLNKMLQNCRDIKDKHHNMIFNASMFGIFIFSLLCLLIYKWKGKLTDDELEIKENEKKQYILSRIQNYQEFKKRSQQALITGLPYF
jgi:hypothetical protein